MSEVPRFPKPNPEHNLWFADPNIRCPACDRFRFENIGVAFQNRWQCLDCGYVIGPVLPAKWAAVQS